MKEIQLTQGKTALVDDEDFAELSKYKWSLSKYGYVYTSKDKKHLFIHRFIMNTPKGKFTDHINCNRLDNRKENLRIVNKQQNAQNRTKLKGKSKYKGVYLHEDHKKNWSTWKVDIYLGKKIAIGYFENDRHAAMAYDIWAKVLFEEYAKLNFPDALGIKP